VALITGASRGIGAAIAHTLATSGADVALLARGGEQLETVGQAIRALGAKVATIASDLRAPGSASAAVARAASELGPVDILVNNAALQLFGPILEFGEDEFRAMVDVNLTAPYALTKAVLPSMVSKRQGWIVSIASDLAYRVRAGGAAYCSTKRALLALAEVIQLEHRQDGIRASVILPGITATTWDGLPPAHPSKEGHLDPSQIAEAVLWCCTRPDGARVDLVSLHPATQESV
jgi:3-oxoacyl-[acyl-carrier protein] reductase